MIRTADGPVLSEDAGFVVAAGKAVVGNPTHLRTLYESGHWDSSRLVGDIQSKRFGLIILNAELYPAPVLAAVGRFYCVVENIPLAAATYHIFLPGGDRVESD